QPYCSCSLPARYSPLPSATSNTSSVRSPHRACAWPLIWVHLPEMMSLFICVTSLMGERSPRLRWIRVHHAGLHMSARSRFRWLVFTSMTADSAGPSAGIGGAGVIGRVLDLLADLLHVLASTGNGVAGGKHARGKQRDENEDCDALHGNSPLMDDRRGGGAPLPPSDAGAGDIRVEAATWRLSMVDSHSSTAHSRASAWTGRTGSPPDPPPGARCGCGGPAPG